MRTVTAEIALPSIGAFEMLILMPILAWLAYRAYRFAIHLAAERYFESEVFQSHKQKLQMYVQENNEIARYAESLRNHGTFSLGNSDSGRHSHFAEFQNTSRHNYRRDRNIAEYGSRNVHNCSLQVVRNAHADPIKYVMKYFGIKADVETLAEVKNLNENLTRLEGAIENLELRKQSITTEFNPPWYVKQYHSADFMKQIGVKVSSITVPYPRFSFQYVSAGGNSSQSTNITFTTEFIEELIDTLAEKIRFRQSAAGQRALMTKSLRHFIKDRDGHTCQNCGISVAQEPHLLLEVDHIIPVSKGGLSVQENLQTLCWRCNRTKSNKIEIGQLD